MCGKFNIKVSGTASFSPWSNGTSERHNHLITTMLVKIRDEVKCSYDAALAWVINEKKSLINHNDFSQSQIAFGKNSNLPNILNDALPALEKVTTSADLAIHIAVLHSAILAFMKAQTLEKIKFALKSKLDKPEKDLKLARKYYR